MTAVIGEQEVAAGEPPLGEPRPRPGQGPPRGRVTAADRLFRLVLRVSGWLVLVIMLLVGLFLGYRSLEALVAVFFAFPLAFGTALFISEYAPLKLKRGLITLVDLMAAVPSIVFGIWGFLLLQYQIVGVSRWMSTYLSWIPVFRVDGADPDDPLSPATVFTSSTFIAGIVVALMVTPIATSVMREVFTSAPPGEREGAYALGATKWGMIRAVVLPFGRGGIIGGTMLGLGRALGETIAVLLILSPLFEIQWHVLQNGGSTVSALIALRYGESTPFSLSALFAAGLALFLLTLVINFAAGAVVARSRSGAGAEA